jgi:hypothetical protein
VAALFDRTVDFDADVFRNITSLRESRDLFDDITEGGAFANAVAVAAEMRVKAGAPPGIVGRGFHYSTAIGYPFETEPYLSTRYSNGSFGVWYGSVELKTSIHETAYHMLADELKVEGNAGVIKRERAVYLIRCRALLIDLRGKEKEFPGLIGDGYGLTHEIGERLHTEGHPGLLAPSARCKGTNLAAFTPAILSEPRHHCYLTYKCDVPGRKIIVERQSGKTFLKLEFR